MEANIIIMGMLVVILFGGIYLSIIAKRLFNERQKVLILLKEKQELENKLNVCQSYCEKREKAGKNGEHPYFSH